MLTPPGEHRGFIKAWEKLEKKIGGSKGLVSLTLNKPAGKQTQLAVLGQLRQATIGQPGASDEWRAWCI